MGVLRCDIYVLPDVFSCTAPAACCRPIYLERSVLLTLKSSDIMASWHLLSVNCISFILVRTYAIVQMFQKAPPQIAKFMEPTWGPPGSCRPQMGPMLAPRILLSGHSSNYTFSPIVNPDIRCVDSQEIKRVNAKKTMVVGRYRLIS